MTRKPLQLKRGLLARIQALGLAYGEPAIAVDDPTKPKLLIGDQAGNPREVSGGGGGGLSRVAVADQDYVVGEGSVIIGYTSLTAPRSIYLPTPGSSGQRVVVQDESGNCSSEKRLNIHRSGEDTINCARGAGLELVKIMQPYDSLTFTATGAGKWITDHIPDGLLGATTYSPVDSCVAAGLNSTSNNVSLGCSWVASSGVSCVGVRFYGFAGKTYRLSIWRGGLRLASVDVTATSDGVMTGRFANPIYPAIGVVHIASYYELNSSLGMRETGGSTVLPAPMNSVVTINSTHLFAFGDNCPANTSGGWFPVEPVCE